MTVPSQDVFRSGRLLLRGAYPALVSALAAGVLVLLLWPQRERSFLAEAVASGTGGDAPPAEEVLAWLKSDEVLRGAVTNLRNSQPRELAALVELGQDDPAVALRPQLSLVSLASPDERLRLAIGCQAPRRAVALAIADELARQLADHHPAHIRRKTLANLEDRQRRAGAELQAAQSAEERLAVELQGLRHAQLASAVAAASATASIAPADPAAADSASELARTLGALKLERDRLLEIYLPAHPQIQTLSAQISRLEESLRRSAARPDLHGAVAPRGGEHHPINTVLLEWRRESEGSATPASGEKALPPAADSRAELAATISQTQLDLLAATHRRQESEHAWQKLADERKQIESAGEIHWQTEPARVSAAGGGGSPRHPLAAALVAATIGGLGIGWLAAHNQRLTTSAEVATALAVPVIATLGGGECDLPGIPPSRSQTAVQWTTRFAEVVLATFVLTLLAAIALDRGLVTDLVHDPLATLGELMQRLI